MKLEYEKKVNDLMKRLSQTQAELEVERKEREALLSEVSEVTGDLFALQEMLIHEARVSDNKEIC